MSAGERWVLLGLARARAPWFSEVARWATSASLAAEFTKCLTAEEVRARLASGRPHSALLVDAGVPGLDRDLVAVAAAAGTAVLAVDDGRGPRWSSDLGVAATLPATFDRPALLDALQAHARPVGRTDVLPPLLDDEQAGGWRGRLVAVCGPGGTGASTAAIALAQAAAAEVRLGGRVVLADLARHAEQAVLHDAPEPGPGLQELVEAHRLGRPGPDEVWAMTFEVPRRGYRLLLGLRRPEAWSTLRPRAADAALDGLRRAFGLTVADVDGDVEGEDQGGSLDVEERNHLARSVVAAADVVVAVGAPGLKGTHALGVLLRELVAAGVEPPRLLPVVNRAPRHPRPRAELARALAVSSGGLAAGPAWVPERRVEEALIDGAPLPAQVVGPLAGPVRHLLDAHPVGPAGPAPVPVAPGSLGTWAGEDVAG